jgi:aldose 1-epimerase
MPTRLITLRDAQALVQVAPAWGAALTRYDFAPDAATPMRPVLRPWDGVVDGAQHPFALACNVLLPWSNRIGAGGFHYDGVWYPVAANVAGEPCPLHGNGFQSAWDVVLQDPHSVELRLRSRRCKPFDYAAQLRYSLDQGVLTITLSVTHHGPKPLPYGIGLHPWLLRAADSVLSFDASHFWTEAPDHLPLQRLPNDAQGAMDFAAPRPLPQGWINTAFEGWGDHATLASKAAGLCVELRASASLSNLLVYSPAGNAGFVCLETVSHIPNAHGISALAPGAALTRLVRGQSLAGWLRIKPARYQP